MKYYQVAKINANLFLVVIDQDNDNWFIHGKCKTFISPIYKLPKVCYTWRQAFYFVVNELSSLLVFL